MKPNEKPSAVELSASEMEKVNGGGYARTPTTAGARWTKTTMYECDGGHRYNLELAFQNNMICPYCQKQLKPAAGTGDLTEE